jgi:hypothetical protein
MMKMGTFKNALAGFNGVCRKFMDAQHYQLQAWQWFLLLYLLGFSSLLLLAFLLKMLIKAL